MPTFPRTLTLRGAVPLFEVLGLSVFLCPSGFVFLPKIKWPAKGRKRKRYGFHQWTLQRIGFENSVVSVCFRVQGSHDSISFPVAGCGSSFQAPTSLTALATMAQQQRVNPVSLLKEWARQKRPTQLLTSDFEQSNAASPPTDPDSCRSRVVRHASVLSAFSWRCQRAGAQC